MQTPAGNSLAAGAEGDEGHCSGNFLASEGDFLAAVEVEKSFLMVCQYALQGREGAGKEGVVGVVEAIAEDA